MATGASRLATLPLAQLETSFRCVRCIRPTLVDQMASSLSVHGQLTPVVAAERSQRLELLDGFKRWDAARQLGLATLSVSVTPMDEVSQWAMMLALNQGAGRMTELEEALVLQKIVANGFTQVQVAQLVHRHKSWVSRRVGLLERLHPELVEGMRMGLLHPGVARRLLPLPPGNQLQVATAAQQARLGPRDTELLVRLWQRAKDAEVRRQLLAQPAAALKAAFPELSRPTPDPRLTAEGQQLSSLLHQLGLVASRAARLLPPVGPDLPLLAPLWSRTRQDLYRLTSAPGLSANDAPGSASDVSGATGSSSS